MFKVDNKIMTVRTNIYIPVPDENIPTLRPVIADRLNQDEYQILEDPLKKELSFFSEGQIVRCKTHVLPGLFAIVRRAIVEQFDAKPYHGFHDQTQVKTPITKTANSFGFSDEKKQLVGHPIDRPRGIRGPECDDSQLIIFDIVKNASYTGTSIGASDVFTHLDSNTVFALCYFAPLSYPNEINKIIKLDAGSWLSG